LEIKNSISIALVLLSGVALQAAENVCSAKPADLHLALKDIQGKSVNLSDYYSPSTLHVSRCPAPQAKPKPIFPAC
jgi:hypothetical protein